MTTFDWLKLTLLAAIWGSSFIFMKILAPILGVVPTACLRILISGMVLITSLKLIGTDLEIRKNLRHYAVVGLVNASIPFLLYSFAALHAPSSLSVIMNSTTPLFGAFFSLLWLNEAMTLQKALGFALGSAGVTLIALTGSHSDSSLPIDFMTLLSALAGLVAAACYALASVYMKKRARDVKPFAMAGMSHLIGGLILLPLALSAYSSHPFGAEILQFKIAGSLACLSLICSAAGFMIFYHLVEKIGATQTLTVGYLIPAFGMLWGSLFLGEVIRTEMILGTGMILAAVAAISFKKKNSNATLDKMIAREKESASLEKSNQASSA